MTGRRREASDHAAVAHVGGRVAWGLRDRTDDLTALDSHGFWAVVRTYEGATTALRFDHVQDGAPDPGPWIGPDPSVWRSSLDEHEYIAGVQRIRDHIAAGDVYQANLCRVMRAPLPESTAMDTTGLAWLLARGNPAPHAALIRDGGELDVVSASPELYLRRDGRQISSSPIKGTGRTEADLLEKDRAENIMIVDLVRHDLSAVCAPGSVRVSRLLDVEQHPGLVHLVSTVNGQLRPDAGWADLLTDTFPPGSVTGAPKISAMGILRACEPVPRGPYCGAIGWVDADQQTGSLAVGIRTFWRDGADLCFGTGAGITWDSDPVGEWKETQLKADRLIRVASGSTLENGKHPT